MDKLAAETINIAAANQWGVLGNLTLTGLIPVFITIALIIAALIFFFMLIFGGIKYITSGGDKQKAESARGMITAALIGLVIVFAAWAIINLVGTFFSINLLQFDIPNAWGN